MVITPDSKVKLIKNPLKLDNNNELMFANATSQYNYFTSLPKLEFDSLTYVRKDGVLRIETDDNLTYEDLLEYNFCMYQNTHFDNKWFYAFITDITWVNPSLVDIKIETAYFQTWQFDLVFKDSFIEREHVNDDTIGLHTIPEGLETGEYIVNSSYYYNNLDTCKYIIQVTEWATTGDKPLATNYGGVYMAGGAYICSNMSEVVTILNQYATAGKSEAVYNVYMCPSSLINNTSETLQYSGQVSPVVNTYTLNKVNTIGGYSPKNNKVLCFPYQYLLISNNNGSSNILQLERFSGNTCDFSIKGVPVVGASVKLIPTNYDSTYNQEEEGLIGGKFPTLNWSEDEYTNWLTQNSVNIGIGVASSGLTILGGAGMMLNPTTAMAGASSVLSGVMSITNQMGAIYQHSLQPNSAKGNVNGGDINVCSGKNGFYFYNMSIKQEYSKVIDNYFSMFGYKVNRLGTPHLHARTYYDYIKTIDANIEGDIPEADLNQIRNMFNNGIRFWHDTTKYLDFSVNNTIIS